MSTSHRNNLKERAAQGLVTHDNTGGYFVVECQGCSAVYPSFQCVGGGQIADTGDYDDARCPHCGQEAPEECDNVGLAWNTQQERINALQSDLNTRDEQIGALTFSDNDRELSRRSWFDEAKRLEKEVEALRAEVKRLDLMGAQSDYKYDQRYAQFERVLAERDALLERCRLAVANGEDFDLPASLLDEIKALSASAEPSDYLKSCEAAHRALSLEPSAPVECDERAECAICLDLGDQCLECEEAEFREWAERHFASADFRKTAAGVFIQDWMRHAFAAWQARAALERKPCH